MNVHPLLEARNISKKFLFPTPAILFSEINLKIMPQESVAIVGRSGEGKSTLLHILASLEDACSGAIYIQGQKVDAYNRNYFRNQHLGFIFQSFHLLEDYSVLQNVLMPAHIARHSIKKGSTCFKRALELLHKVELLDFAHFPVKLLSGGQKQRVAFARALCNNPTLLFADEPTGNLDRQTADFIHQLLIEFGQTPQKALLLVTHDVSLANLCTKRYKLSSGKLGSVVN